MYGNRTFSLRARLKTAEWKFCILSVRRRNVLQSPSILTAGVSAGAGKKTEPLGKVRSELEFTVSISIFPPGLEFTISIFWQTQREYFNLTDPAKKEYFNKTV